MSGYGLAVFSGFGVADVLIFHGHLAGRGGILDLFILVSGLVVALAE